MNLIEVKTREKAKAYIDRVSASEIRDIIKSKRFDFNWDEEKKYDVYKLRLNEPDEIIGLMSLIDWPDEFRIEIHLIESSKENIGRIKKYDNIAGCLIAFACGISFERGYAGFISLVPKTVLRKHYIKEYGMEDAGKAVFSDTTNSARLIDKYL